jgi:HIRAN domain
MQTALQQFHALYVAWQQPESRRYYPVARLVAGAGEARDLYEFAYIRGAEEAAKDGFQPFLAFANLTEVSRSKELFPFFSNRLMSRNRPDFPNYIQSLGLDLNADPMLILARSGGTRATDSIELFPLPVRADENGIFQTFFWMHGFRHLDDGQRSRVLSLQPGEELFAWPNADNPVDPNAIQLRTTEQIMIGYLPRYLTNDVVHFLNAGVEFHVFVERVNPPPAPTQQRLLCRFDAAWPKDFQPFASDTFQPVCSDAIDLRQ